MNFRFYRSRRDSKVFGLCGGLAEQFNVDPTLLRLIVAITTFFTGGTMILIYVVASMVIPKEPAFEAPYTGGGFQTAFASGFGCKGHAKYAGGYGGQSNSYANAAPTADNLDEMMKDIEQKALRKELEELRAKVARFEQQQNQQPKGEI